jgi:hypothetical protein
LLGSTTEIDAIDEHICDLLLASLAEDYLVVPGGLSRERGLDLVRTVNTVTDRTVKSRREGDSFGRYGNSSTESTGSSPVTVTGIRCVTGRKAKEGEGDDVATACTCVVWHWCDAVSCASERAVAGKTRWAA